MAACENLFNFKACSPFIATNTTTNDSSLSFCRPNGGNSIRRCRPAGRSNLPKVGICDLMRLDAQCRLPYRKFPHVFDWRYSRRNCTSKCSLLEGVSSSTDANGAASLDLAETESSPSISIESDGSLAGNETEDSSAVTPEETGSPIETVGGPSVKQQKTQPLKRIFSSGSRRAEVKLPGLILRLGVDDVLREQNKDILLTLDSAVAAGFTMVVLESGTVDGVGGARLYEAACVMKALLRGRAELLVAERVDIAAAAGAGGVLLSDEGLPPVVARSMMQNAISESAVLPLVGRIVKTAQSALSATASEGADFLILQVSDEKDARTLVSSVCEEVSIPVFVQVSVAGRVESGLQAIQAGASGLVLEGLEMNAASHDVLNYSASLVSSVGQIFQQTAAIPVDSISGEMSSLVSNTLKNLVETPLKTLDAQAKEILEEERVLLTSMIDLVQEASPEMEEVSLLVDAVAQLDEPFLLVIVGEYNSGKSSVINALLGKRFLKDGVLPTTNEITVLKHAGDGRDEGERSERHPDGHFLRFLPAELLKQMNLVDTPGTNVILQRQQRLTEEFVPRADLVLFVLSADRPLTESEMRFLRYIRQWGKKIIFILNKSDVFSNSKELEEVMRFVKDNVQKLLSVEQAIVYPVSARNALKAKITASGEDGVVDTQKILECSLWESSGFGKLESFINDFLGGSSEAGAERMRLKLETPIGIALALLSACEGQLSSEAAKAEADLKVLDGAVMQLQNFQQDMENNGVLHRQKALAVIEAAKKRGEKLVDSILRLSNIEAFAKYLLGGDRTGSLPVSGGFDKEVIGSAVSDVQRMLKDHQAWLEANFTQQISNYKELVTSRWPDLRYNLELERTTNEWQSLQPRDQDYWQHKESIAVLEDFDTKAAMIVLEQELKEVILGTFGALGAAGASASVLTSILPTTLEDLIALGICSAGGLIGVWNLPKRRGEVKQKIQRVADSLAKQIEIAMEEELKTSVQRVRAEIDEVVRPYCNAIQAELSRVEALQGQVYDTTNKLQALRLKVQNLGTF